MHMTYSTCMYVHVYILPFSVIVIILFLLFYFFILKFFKNLNYNIMYLKVQKLVE